MEPTEEELWETPAAKRRRLDPSLQQVQDIISVGKLLSSPPSPSLPGSLPVSGRLFKEESGGQAKSKL